MTTVDSLVGVDAFVRDWQAWHREHEARLAAPHGFLAITSLHWLTAHPRRYPDAPGRWWTTPNGVVVDVDDEEPIAVNGREVCGRYGFGPVEERGGINAVSGDAVLEVARRGGFDILRPRHPDHPLRLAFRGTPAYDPHSSWVIEGRYVPYDVPRPVTVGAAVEGLQHVYEAQGRVEFELDGRVLALTVFNGHTPGTLTALFLDETSGVTTYAANRSLAIQAPTVDGRVTLDFNRAVNLPCAYTEFATCPLPPTENRLPVAIEAGEQIPFERR